MNEFLHNYWIFLCAMIPVLLVIGSIVAVTLYFNWRNERPWYVIVERETHAGDYLPAYGIGPYDDEMEASIEANSNSGETHCMLTLDAVAEGYIAVGCYLTQSPPKDTIIYEVLYLQE